MSGVQFQQGWDCVYRFCHVHLEMFTIITTSTYLELFEHTIDYNKEVPLQALLVVGLVHTPALHNILALTISTVQ